MTVHTTITCNGHWPGKPCSARTAGIPHMPAAKAREKAAADGWTHNREDGDLCPACSRRRARGPS
jgi:hypothetical protein